jgi:signal peptidase II
MAKKSFTTVRSSSGNPLWLWLLLAAIIIAADQFTKIMIVGWMNLGDSTPITSYFNIVRVHNTGAAFSMLANAGGWQRWFFIGLGAVATGFISYLLVKHGTEKLFAFALACIMGGAIGNVIDRIWHGYVVDFLQFRFGFLEPVFRGGYFPSFNIADMAISCGAMCLILDEILRVMRKKS